MSRYSEYGYTGAHDGTVTADEAAYYSEWGVSIYGPEEVEEVAVTEVTEESSSNMGLWLAAGVGGIWLLSRRGR
jgi:MYXO-CTERM domain-containing protein